MLISPAYAQASGAPDAGIMNIGMLVLMLVVFWFILIRPQMKRSKDHKSMLQLLEKGNEVVTAGGLVGKVTKVVDDNEVLVEIAEGVRVRVIKSTLTDVRSKGEPAASESKAKSDDDK